MAIDQYLLESEQSLKKRSTYRNALEQFEMQFGLDIAVSLITEFVEAMEVVLHDLDASIAQRDSVQLKRLTHRVIGLCPMYNAKPTADLSQLIEDELPDGNWDTIETYNKQLRASFADYLQDR